MANMSGKNFKVTPIKEQLVTKTVFIKYTSFSLFLLYLNIGTPEKISLPYLTALTVNSLEERMKHPFVFHSMLYFAIREDITEP